MAEQPGQPSWRDAASPKASASHAAPDSDGDGIPDAIEQRYGLDANDPEDATSDLDGDGFSNLQAYKMGWPPDAASKSTRDSDGDGISDVVETHWQQYSESLESPEVMDVLNPHRFEDAVRDADGDGVLNVEELNFKLNPLMDFSLGIASDWEMAQIFSGQNWLPPFSILEDADGDGLSDLWEYRYGFDLRNPLTSDEDPDADGVSNREEFARGTHPLLRDSGMSSQAQSDATSRGDGVTKASSGASVRARSQQEKMKAFAELRRSRNSRAKFRRPGTQSTSSFDGGAMSLLSSGTVEIVYEEVRVDAGGFVYDDEIFGPDQGGYVSSNSNPIGIDTSSVGEAMTTSLIWAATGTFSEVGVASPGQPVSTYTFLSQHSHNEGGEEGAMWSQDNWWWQHGMVRFYLRDTTPGAPTPEPQAMIAIRLRIEYIYNESIQDWVEQPEQILEVRPHMIGTDPTTAEPLTITQNYSSNNNYSEEYFYLTPIEVMQPSEGATQGSLTRVDRIRPCRWLDNAMTGSGGINLGSFPEQDADRIVVRVFLPHLKGQTGVTISVATEDENQDHTDAPTLINLVETATNSGVFESLPFVIVTDNDDDQAVAGTPGGSDDTSNDRTHRAELGDVLVLTSSAWGSGSVRVPIREPTHFVEVTSVILDIAGDDLSVAAAQVKLNSQSDWMVCAYRPYGIDVLHTDGGVITVDATNKPALYNVLTSLDPSTGEPTIDPVASGSSSDGEIILSDPDVAALKAGDNILLVYLNANFSNGGVGQNQVATGFEGNILISNRMLVELGQDPSTSNLKLYTTAHECGHAFGLFHVYLPDGGGGLTEPPKFNLMREGATRWGREPYDAGQSGRRLLREQLNSIYLSPYLKVITVPMP